MGKIEDSLIEAISIITDNAVDKAGYDKTIQASIVTCTDASKGQYKVKYQDNVFYAYSNNSNVTYPKNTLVYVLVPGNNLSNQKTIIGTVGKLGTNYLTEVSNESKFNIVGSNCINSLYVGELNSYHVELKTLYDSHLGINEISLNVDDVNAYIKNAEYLVCGASFQTALDQSQQQKGNYGIVYQLEFQDNTRNEIVTRSYVVDVDKMSGNPYKFLQPTRQVGYFNIDGKNFIRVKRIDIFARSFPLQDYTDTTNDIFVSDFQLYGATALTEQELSEYALSLSTPLGAYFNKYSTSESKLRITAQILVKGLPIYEYDDAKFYWFIENAAIKNTDKYYNEYGGAGWKCLNEFNVIEEETQLIEWLPAERSFELSLDLATARENTIKCVAVYNDTTIAKEVVIKNLLAANITIVSDSGVEFYYDSGNPTITCLVDGAEVPEYQYSWIKVDNNGTIEQILNNDNNKLTVQMNTITDYAIFKCAVSNGDVYLGTGSITLSNTLASVGTYRLSIVNGTQVFKYDENGISPASSTKDDAIEIPKLVLELYNAEAGLISNDVLKNFDIEWHIPAKNSLLSVQESGSNNGDEIIVTGQTELEYSIASIYNYFSTNNQITVNVNYQGQKLTAITDFLFLKEGENGTNGTDFVCRIVPNIPDLSKAPDNVVITNGAINYTPIQANKWFRAQLWQNGELVFDNTQSQDKFKLTWSILQNQYTRTIKDASDIAVDASSGTFSYIGYSESRHPADIVKATIEYENNVYTAIIPVIVANLKNIGYNISVKEHAGFKTVLYTSDGKTPRYSNINPFEVNVDQNGTDISENANITYQWRVRGEIYQNNNWTAVENLKFQNYASVSHNQKKVTPIDSYDGQCVTNAIECIIFVDSAEIGRVHIPVHMSLNKYGLAALNGWDGNSIQIDEEGGFILSPQVGAGRKEPDNSYTGILMGEVKEGTSAKKDVGLIGYTKGNRSIFLDAETGKAEFGVNGRGQVIIDPTSNTAIIKSGNYSTVTKEGMMIDFTTPEIKFGSGNFTVNKKGEMNARVGAIGDNQNNQIHIGGNEANSYIYSGTKSGINVNQEGFYLGTNGIALGPLTNKDQGDPVSIFQVNKDGSMYVSNLNIQSSETEGSSIKLKIDKEDNAAILFYHDQISTGYINGTSEIDEKSDGSVDYHGMEIYGHDAILINTPRLYVTQGKGMNIGLTETFSVLAESYTTGFLFWKKTVQSRTTLNFVNGILCTISTASAGGVDTSNTAIANRIDDLTQYYGPTSDGYFYDVDRNKWYIYKDSSSTNVSMIKVNMVRESDYSKYIYIATQDKVTRWEERQGLEITPTTFQLEERTIGFVGTNSDGSSSVTYKPVFNFKYEVFVDENNDEVLTLKTINVIMNGAEAIYTYNQNTDTVSFNSVSDPNNTNFFVARTGDQNYSLWNIICEKIDVPNLKAESTEAREKLKNWSESLSLKLYSTQIYKFIDKYEPEPPQGGEV